MCVVMGNAVARRNWDMSSRDVLPVKVAVQRSSAGREAGCMPRRRRGQRVCSVLTLGRGGRREVPGTGSRQQVKAW